MARTRHLTIVFGDQLHIHSGAFSGFDPVKDMVWMAEVKGESTYVPSHKIRTALFLSAMRHFAQELREKGYRLEYRKLDAEDNDGQLEPELRKAVARFKPERIVVVEPGEYRIEQMLKALAEELNLPLEIRPDRTFSVVVRSLWLGRNSKINCAWSFSIGKCANELRS